MPHRDNIGPIVDPCDLAALAIRHEYNFYVWVYNGIQFL